MTDTVRTVPAYGPIQTCPKALRPPHDTYPEQFEGKADNLAALLAAVDGLELGAYDRRILDWLADWESSTVAIVVSLLHRVRATGPAELEQRLNDTYYDRDVIRDERDALQAALDNLQGGDR